MKGADFTLHGSTAVLKSTTELSSVSSGEFPDYQQVIPKEKKKICLFSTRSLSCAIPLLVLTAERAWGEIAMEKGKMTISVNTPDLGEGVEEIELENAEKNLIIV
jgi:DNA polymerase III sliding clamp (beta) subunit (PCNA family)